MSEQAAWVQRAAVPFTATSRKIGAAVDGIAELVKLEVVVAILCLFIPVFVVYGDGWNLRGHISAYYSMTAAQYFYMPLTVAGMLFVVNGVVKHRHWYNVGLGVSLLTLTFLDYQAHNVVHSAAAIAFFGGNALVFVIFTPKKELWFKAVLAGIIVVAMVGHFVLGWYSLFFAESFSLWVIAIHFALEAAGVVE